MESFVNLNAVQLSRDSEDGNVHAEASSFRRFIPCVSCINVVLFYELVLIINFDYQNKGNCPLNILSKRSTSLYF